MPIDAICSDFKGSKNNKFAICIDFKDSKNNNFR